MCHGHWVPPRHLWPLAVHLERDDAGQARPHHKPALDERLGDTGRQTERIGLSAVPDAWASAVSGFAGGTGPWGAASTMIRSSRDVTRVAGATVSAGRTLPGHRRAVDQRALVRVWV